MSKSEFGIDLKRYITGFVLCLIVTLLSFAVVLYGDFGPTLKIASILLLAAIQLGLQSYYFLHLGDKSTGKWNTITYAYMIMTVAIIVLGSLWVMANLNYNMKHDAKSDEMRMYEDEGYGGTKSMSH